MQSKRKETALLLACQNQHQELIPLLHEEAGAQAEDFRFALQLAVANKFSLENVKLLMKEADIK